MNDRPAQNGGREDDSVTLVDMSPAAINHRLDIAAELFELGRHLAGARPVGDGTAEPQAADPLVSVPRDAEN